MYGARSQDSVVSFGWISGWHGLGEGRVHEGPRELEMLCHFLATVFSCVQAFMFS
jgi:hypothetical protein